jgi:hypothetical protein
MSLMRKGHLSVAAAVAVASALLVLAFTAAWASARQSSAKPRTETEFTVFDKTIAARNTANGGVVFRDILAEANDHSELVGHLRGVGTPCGHGCFRLKVRVHIFGAGDLEVRGKFLESATHRQNQRLIIIGGSGEFNGAAGKVIVHSLPRPRGSSLLKFDFVQ